MQSTVLRLYLLMTLSLIAGLARSTIVAQLDLQDFNGNPENVSVEMSFYQGTNPVPVFQDWPMVESNFRISSDGPPAAGHYTVKVKASHWLSDSVANIYLSPSTHPGIISFELENGDCDGNDVVDLADYTHIALALNAQPGDSNWDPEADLNGDDIVDLTDYTILAQNFNTQGKTPRTLTTLGRSFFFAIPRNDAMQSGPIEYYLRISGEPGTTGSTSCPAVPGTMQFSIPASGFTSVPLPATWIVQPNASPVTGISNRFVRVNANAPILATFHDETSFEGESMSLMPLHSFGLDFVVSSYSPDLSRGTQVAVVAPFGGNLTIVPTSDITLDGTTVAQQSGQPYTVNLGTGNVVYYLEGKPNSSGGSTGDLTGTQITSDRPITVISGNYALDIGPAWANRLLEQLVPTDVLGKEIVYYPTPERYSTSYDRLRIVITRENTFLTFRGVTSGPHSRGEVIKINENYTFSSAPGLIQATKPIMVTQFTSGGGGTSESGGGPGDPSMTLLPAVEHFRNSAEMFAPMGLTESMPNNWQNYVAVYVHGNYRAGMKLDGVLIDTPTLQKFQEVTGSPYYAAHLPITPGLHSLSNTNPFAVFGTVAYGFATTDAYASAGPVGFVFNGGIATAPAKPNLISATPLSDSEIELAWNCNPTNVEGFKIYRSSEDPQAIGTFFPYELVGYAPAAATSYIDTGLAHRRAYRYKIMAFGDLVSPVSDVREATTFDKLPGLATLNGGSSVWHTVALSWVPDTSPSVGLVDQYEIQWQPDGQQTWQLLGTYTEPIRSESHTGRTQMTAYHYKIRAGNERGWGEWSDSITVATVDKIPDAPTNLLITNISPTEQNLTWQCTATNETEFKIYRRLASEASYFEVGSVGANVHTFLSTGLKGKKVYHYEVRAYNSGGLSAAAYNSLETLPPLVPDAVISFTATALSSTSIKLDWVPDEDPEVDQFEIQRKVGTTWTNPVVVMKDFGVVTHTVTGLTAETSYTFRIRQKNVTGSGTWVEATKATLGPVKAPIDVEAVATSSTSIRVYFNRVEGATGYKVYRSTTQGQFNYNSPVAILGDENHIFDDYALTTEQDYFYVVRSLRENEESPSSPESWHFPNTDALPWNQGGAAILAQINSDSPPMGDFEEPMGSGFTMIGAPDDSVVYSGHVIAQHNPAKYDPDTLEGTSEGQVTPGAKVDEKLPPLNPEGPYYRKVANLTATQQSPIIGIHVKGYIPSFGTSNSSPSYLNSSPFNTVKESPHFYIGFAGEVNAEVGFQYNAPFQSFPARFTPYVRDGNRPKRNNGQYIQPNGATTYDRVMMLPPYAQQAFISASGSGLGLTFEIRARFDVRSKTIRFYSQAFDGNTLKRARLALVVKSAPLADIQLWQTKALSAKPRYVFAIAQGATSSSPSATYFQNYQELAVLNLPNAFWPTGSKMENMQILQEKLIRQSGFGDPVSSLEPFSNFSPSTTLTRDCTSQQGQFISIVAQ